jgi:RimJ/RimL family protein N-acetyltransferase
MKLSPFTTTLKEGQSVLVREVTPDDRHLLEVGFDHLSDESQYFRFLAARHHLTAKELDVFTTYNGPDHVAIGAIVEGSAEPEPIGIARYVHIPDLKTTAEIAITIADSHHRQGLSILLLGALAKFAQVNGITEFYALVHPKNTAMLGLLEHLGGRQNQLDGEEIEVRLPVNNASNLHIGSSTGETFRNTQSLATIT